MQSPLKCLVAAFLLLLALQPAWVSAQAEPGNVQFDLPAGELAEALNLYSRQASVTLSFEPYLVEGKTSTAISGSYRPGDALILLLQGSGLMAVPVGEGTWALRSSSQGNPAAINLAPLQVRGIGIREQSYQTAGSVSVITREEMDRLPPRNTSDLFVGIPGVTAVASRQNPGVSINIRGLQDFGRVNVMIDGARQNYQQTGHGSNGHVYVDPELLSNVTVTKGPSSTAGGAAMIGGTVNFGTLEADDVIRSGQDQGVRLNLTTGTNAYDFAGSLAAATRLGRHFSLLGVISYKNVGEFKPGKKGTLFQSDETVLFSSQNQTSGLLKASADLDDHQLKFSYMSYEAEFSTGSRPFIDQDVVTTDLFSLGWKWQPEGSLINLDTRIYHTATSNDQFRPDRGNAGLGGYSAFDIYYETTTLGGSLENSSFFSWGKTDGVFTLGGEFFIDETSPNAKGTTGGSPLWFAGATPEGRRDVFSGFAQIELERGIYEAILGVRQDYYRLQGNGMIHSGVVVNPTVPGLPPSASTIYTLFDIDRAEQQLAPKLTLAVNPTHWLKLYTSYGKGFRPPAITETMLHGAHVGGMFPYYPNPTLREERSSSFEVGANFNLDGLVFQDDRLMARLAWFHNRVEHFMIMAQAMGPADSNAQAWAFVNLDNPVGVDGIEFQADYETTHFFANASFTHLSFDWGDVSYDAFPLGSQIGYPKPQPPAGTFNALWQYSIPPENKASLSLGLRFFGERLSFGTRSRYTAGGKDSGLASGSAWPSYTLHDAWAAWKVTPRLTLRTSIDNLFDKAYVEAMGAGLVVGPGRTALFTLNLVL